jgi:hypothetical protein
MSLQLFAERHPEYDFFWNWEMDVRYTADYQTLFPAVASWADKQPHEGLWQRNTRFPILSNSQSLAELERSSAAMPVSRPWSNWTDHSTSSNDTDLITLFPTFETTNTRWPHRDYLVNYGKSVDVRFGTVGTNMRLSRRMLDLMSWENRQGRAMMSEMWPPTLAYHHGLKTVYVPHPIFFDEEWSEAELESTFNGGLDGRVGGSAGSIINHETLFARATWYWDARVPLQLYHDWMASAFDGSRLSKVCHTCMRLNVQATDRPAEPYMSSRNASSSSKSSTITFGPMTNRNGPSYNPR